MITQELLDYVRGELARGIEKEAIIQALVTGGWTLQDATDAMVTLTELPKPIPSEPPISSPAPTTPISASATVQAPVSSPVATPISSPSINPSQPASTLKQKAAEIETTFKEAVAQVHEIDGKQRQVVTDSIKELEQKEMDNVKKRLGMS